MELLFDLLIPHQTSESHSEGSLKEGQIKYRFFFLDQIIEVLTTSAS
jgi:hypothetical protein